MKAGPDIAAVAALIGDPARANILSALMSGKALPASRAPLCRDCLDWSERRAHLAGRVGRAMLTRMEELGWAKRVPETRIVRFSRLGEAGFAEAFPQV